MSDANLELGDARLVFISAERFGDVVKVRYRNDISDWSNITYLNRGERYEDIILIKHRQLYTELEPL